MTETQQLQQDVENLKKQLGESQRRSRVYLQNVAHQLTAPLGAIKWNIEALEDEVIPVHQKQKLLKSVRSQATILVHLIKNFALMSNLDADEELGQLGNQINVDLKRLAFDLAGDYRPQADEVEKKIYVDAESFDNILDDRKILVEKNLVAQALSNLLENAVKYADTQTTIRISAEKVGGIGVSVLSIGLPIQQGDKDKVFERSFRGSEAKQKVAAGTGIGLYLAKRIMTLHQGDILLQCDRKQSRFTLVLKQAH